MACKRRNGRPQRQISDPLRNPVSADAGVSTPVSPESKLPRHSPLADLPESKINSSEEHCWENKTKTAASASAKMCYKQENPDSVSGSCKENDCGSGLDNCGKGTRLLNTPRSKQKMQNKLLNAAKRNDCKNVIKCLASSNPNCCNSHDALTPLHYTVKHGCFKCCQNLLKSKANVNARDNSGVTPLMLACERNNVDLCRLLIKYAADTDIKTVEGETVLHFATFSGVYRNYDCCKVLLNSGANVNARTKTGVTPLHMLTNYQVRDDSNKLNIDILVDFIKHGAKVDTPGSFQEVHNGRPVTPFELAVLLTNIPAMVVFTEAGFQMPLTLIRNRTNGQQSGRIVQNHPHLLNYLNDRLSRPVSLRNLCRNSITNSISTTVCRKNALAQLGLPKTMFSYLQYDELVTSCQNEAVRLLRNQSSEESDTNDKCMILEMCDEIVAQNCTDIYY